MELLNPFEYKNNGILPIVSKDYSNLEKKYTTPINWPLYINSSEKSCNDTMTIRRALSFYDKAAPVATAIDWINDEFKTLQITLKNGDDKEDDADIIRFLRSPNDDMIQEDFLETTGAYFLITNEVYWIATGRQGREPTEILVISPEFVSITKDKDGFISKIKVQTNNQGQLIFNRSESSYRFYTSDGDTEIWQVKGFSSLTDQSYNNDSIGINNLFNSRGRSKLSSIHKEINQYLQVAEHNLTMLDNGMKPSGTINVPDGAVLDDVQYNRLKEQVEKYYSGAQNTAKTLILDNGMTFTPASLTAKDMDFEKLTRTVTISIFNRYKVPLPLISAENMTLANMDTARLNLYDNCVIPLAYRLLRELTNFLAPRFKLTEDMLLCPDMDKITALQIRRNEELKLKKEMDIYTKNELREEVGKEESEGGDILYMSNNMIPLGSSPIQPNTNSGGMIVEDDDTSNDQMKSTRPEFIKIMQAQVDKKGNRVLTDNEINEIADSEGL